MLLMRVVGGYTVVIDACCRGPDATGSHHHQARASSCLVDSVLWHESLRLPGHHHRHQSFHIQLYPQEQKVQSNQIKLFYFESVPIKKRQ